MYSSKPNSSRSYDSQERPYGAPPRRQPDRPYNGYSNRGADRAALYQRPVEEPEVYTGPPRELYVVFKGKYYSGEMLVRIARTGNKIKINKDDIHKDQNSLVDLSNALDLRAFPTLVVAPYEGKYVVLMGNQYIDKLNAEKTEVFMLHNMLLKKAFLWDVK